MVVAHPSSDASPTLGRQRTGAPFVFAYPALARVFKNLEVLCEAARKLHQHGLTGFEIRLMVDGSENRYARWLKANYGDISGLHFLGRQDRAQMATHYREDSALLFPSRLETWGLPITEAKQHGLPMLLADAPYSRETVGTYDLVSFFDPDDADQLADRMTTMIQGRWQPEGNTRQQPAQPFAAHWSELWALLTDTPASQAN